MGLGKAGFGRVGRAGFGRVDRAGFGRMMSRFGLLLAVLLLLLGGTSAAASPRVPVTGASVSSVPSTHDDNVRDQPRQSATARHVPPTAASDGWWVVCQPAFGGTVPHGRSPVSVAGGAESVTAVSAPWSSRATSASVS